jgi:threonine/homoserine/homoserine lactone efflux protein
MSFPAFLVAAVVLAVTPGPGIACVVARARLLSRVSGVTMLGVGACLALARRGA